jgi:hypothetical protein
LSYQRTRLSQSQRASSIPSTSSSSARRSLDRAGERTRPRVLSPAPSPETGGHDPGHPNFPSAAPPPKCEGASEHARARVLSIHTTHLCDPFAAFAALRLIQCLLMFRPAQIARNTLSMTSEFLSCIKPKTR